MFYCKLHTLISLLIFKMSQLIFWTKDCIFNNFRGPHDDLLVGKDLKPAAKRPKLESNQDKEFEEFIHDETDYYKPADNGRNNRNARDNKAKPKSSFEKG